jgi:hypothetical protein
MISKLERQSAQALQAPYNELAAVHEADVIGADETSWRQERGSRLTKVVMFCG